MSLLNLEKEKCKETETTNSLTCPKCKKEVCMHIFEAEDKSLLPLLLNKKADLTFAVCPACSSVFTINEAYLRAKEKGMTVFAEESDLTELKRS